jgi:RNA polymerase sigma factor (sigma-70 family)
MSEAAADRGLRPLVGPLRLLSDERLVRRAVEGDERAFAAIYRRYGQDLYRYCLAILGNPQDAQDALQNAMVKAMRALPGERRQIQLKPWLYRIAHNESIEMLRRRPPTDQLDPELAAGAAGPAEKAEQRARLQRLVADLEQLPERQRGVLVMRELAGLGFEEIGTALGTSPAVVRQTLYEARLSLRQMEEGRELSCDAVTRVLSDADGRVTRRRDLRAHLRECSACREFRDELRRRQQDFASLAPLPAAAAAGILHAALGAGGAGSGGAAAGAAGSAVAGKAIGGVALGGSALVKSTATVAVVAAIGVGAADRGGLVDVGLPGGSSKEAPPAIETSAESSDTAADGGMPLDRGGGEAGGDGAKPRSDGRRSGDPGSAAAEPRQGKAKGLAASGGGKGGSQAQGKAGAPHGDPAAAALGKETAASNKGGGSAKGGQQAGSGTMGSGGAKQGSGGGGSDVASEKKAQAPAQPNPEPPPPPDQSQDAPSPVVPEFAGGPESAPPSAP